MRVMVFTHPGTNSRDILLDVEEGFRDAGHEVIRCELEPLARTAALVSDPRQRAVLTNEIAHIVRSLIEANGIDFSLGMWANAVMSLGIGPADPGGALQTFSGRFGHPHVQFWLDAPHWASSGGIASLWGTPYVAEPGLLHVINNHGTAREMRDVLGFGRVLASPYGINPRVFRPVDIKPEHDLIMNLGPGDPEPTALMLDQLAADEPDMDAIRAENASAARDKLRRYIATRVPSERQAGTIELIDRCIDEQLASPHRPILERFESIAAADPGLKPALKGLTGDPAAFVKAGALIRLVERGRRAFTISWLSRRLDCAIFGSDGLDAWPHQATRYGPAEYRDISAMYGRGRIGLNVMRWQDDEGVNIKPFEITASGRVCLCERRSGLEDLFGIGDEIVTFTAPDEALEVASRLLADQSTLDAIAEAGRARTTRDHTWAAWADRIAVAVANIEAGTRDAA